MRTNQLLINEANLGTRLNQAVTSDRRGEFGLLLAMLSTDARDMAQFHLQSQTEDLNTQLRDRFELAAEQPLVVNMAEVDVVDNSPQFHSAGLVNFHLQEYLTPEALVIRGSDSLEMSRVLANCDQVTRSRYRGQIEPQSMIGDYLHFGDQLVAQRAMAEILA
ncbi:hypothetical protein K0I73_08915 [Shewanella mesophila]|uniref:VC2046/SO_2500 family protein n=1 Tax=Shewanella mesophila TaxID=2864208 RepID=UPI001C65CB8E|nr:VC2046/SO_2500 family protein [Shewanella mesophila]QYJ87773.1 hypothetical protein K0I73_08915 [Shewanella mesophila]